MEYTLWGISRIYSFQSRINVLILILMEYTLWDPSFAIFRTKDGLNPYSNGIYSMSLRDHNSVGRVPHVLILILMEYTLWVNAINAENAKNASLNPYSNGIYSMSSAARVITSARKSLNPYSNGIYSMRSWRKCLITTGLVLILILMEYTLWESLVLLMKMNAISLNPYSNGIYSMRKGDTDDMQAFLNVLILILMEYTLWEYEYIL